MMRKELKIPEELFELSNSEFEKGWQSDKVVIKRFLYGDVLNIEQEAMKVKTNLSGQHTADINVRSVQLSTILKGVLEAPWGIHNISSVEELPPPVASWVFEEINKFNTLEIKKKEV